MQMLRGFFLYSTHQQDTLLQPPLYKYLYYHLTLPADCISLVLQPFISEFLAATRYRLGTSLTLYTYQLI